MRAYLTGGSGFVGTWLRRHLDASGDEVVGGDVEVDVTDAAAVAADLKRTVPDVVFHLAGLAHVGRSFGDPVRTFEVNALGTLKTLGAAAALPSPPRVLVVSSAEVYGRVKASTPLTESSELAPVSPYAASKAAAEMIGLQAFLGGALPVIRVRPFNHVGPGQADAFVVSALARRVVEAERSEGGVAVGNLSPVRDFTDVRDVVRAYRMLAEKGRPGEVYNVASGTGISISDVANLLLAQARKPLELKEDPLLVRAVDVPVLVGDASRLRAVTGWAPERSLGATLADVLDDWRDKLAGDGDPG